MRRLSIALAMLQTVSLTAGCTFGDIDQIACVSSSDCREAFGTGAVCRPDGLCAYESPIARCTEAHPSDLLASLREDRSRIVLGSIFDLSSATHRARRDALVLALEELNELGGVRGRLFGLVSCTSETSPAFDALGIDDASVAAARYLSDVLAVPAILGPPSSGSTEAVFAEVSPRETLVVSPSATSPRLTDLEPVPASDASPGLLWRTAPPDSLQGRVIAADLARRGVTRVAVIEQVGPYGEGLREVFRDAYRTGTVQVFTFSTPADLTNAVAQTGDSTAEEVLFVSSQAADAVYLLSTAATILSDKFVGKRFFFTDSAANPDFVSGTSTDASSLYPLVRGTRPAVASGAVYDTFVASFFAKYGTDVRGFSFTAHSYDAMWLVFYGAAWQLATEHAARVTGTGVARGLRHLSSGTDVDVRPGTWVSVLDAFARGESMDVRGSSGQLDFDPATEETSGAIDIWTIGGDMTSGYSIEVESTVAAP